MNYLFVIGYRVSKIKLISQIRPHMSIFLKVVSHFYQAEPR